ncbi:hypothetical protein ig2599ANME_1944 [groundwater metagenome]
MHKRCKMINMKILKAGGEEFTGSSGGKPISIVLMTAHREFRELDLRRAIERMRMPIIIDGRRVFDQSHASKSPSHASGGRVHVLLRNTWARSREPAGFRSRRVQHFGWTILEQAEEVRRLGFVYSGWGSQRITPQSSQRTQRKRPVNLVILSIRDYLN